MSTVRENLTTLRPFVGVSQLTALSALAQSSEEKEFFVAKLQEYADRVQNTPKPHGQNTVEDPIVYLHFFGRNYDAWVTERDYLPGEIEDPDNDYSQQSQAFAFCSFGGPKDRDAELGFVSIQELIENGIELDLYWTVKPLSEVRK